MTRPVAETDGSRLPAAGSPAEVRDATCEGRWHYRGRPQRLPGPPAPTEASSKGDDVAIGRDRRLAACPPPAESVGGRGVGSCELARGRDDRPAGSGADAPPPAMFVAAEANASVPAISRDRRLGGCVVGKTATRHLRHERRAARGCGQRRCGRLGGSRRRNGRRGGGDRLRGPRGRDQRQAQRDGGHPAGPGAQGRRYPE